MSTEGDLFLNAKINAEPLLARAIKTRWRFFFAGRRRSHDLAGFLPASSGTSSSSTTRAAEKAWASSRSRSSPRTTRGLGAAPPSALHLPPHPADRTGHLNFPDAPRRGPFLKRNPDPIHKKNKPPAHPIQRRWPQLLNDPSHSNDRRFASRPPAVASAIPELPPTAHARSVGRAVRQRRHRRN